MSAATCRARDIVGGSGVFAVVFIRAAPTARVFGVAFPLALVAGDARFPRTLAPNCHRHAANGVWAAKFAAAVEYKFGRADFPPLLYQ